jgi:hypothetical protein
VIGPVAAGPIMLKSGQQIPGTVWEAIFPSQVNLSFNADDKTNGTAGTLIETTSRVNNDPLTIEFQQIFETPISKVAGGLRLNLQKTDTNAVGPAWTGYKLQLIDLVPAPNDPESDEHPPQPHFHPKTATFLLGTKSFNSTNNNLFSATFLGKNQVDPSDTILLGDGKTEVDQNKSVQILNLLIHERQFPIGVIPDPGRRIFDLVETPIIAGAANPEPAAIIQFGTGLLGLLGFAWYRRRRGAA